MKKILIPGLAFAFLLSSGSCHKKDNERHSVIPPCIQNRISNYNMACDHGATVKVYLFQNGEVYAFDPGPCGNDMTIDIYDRNCNYLGSLGGIAGNTKINGEVFAEEAVYRSTVWSN